jgi:hypothetical protein
MSFLLNASEKLSTGFEGLRHLTIEQMRQPWLEVGGLSSDLSSLGQLKRPLFGTDLLNKRDTIK